MSCMMYLALYTLCSFLVFVFVCRRVTATLATGDSAILCYACLPPDTVSLNFSCWKDRKTILVNCSAPENKCIDLLVHGTPDFISLRKTCQPEDAVLNPCLFYNDISYQVAGQQQYLVNDKPHKCVCLDVCDAAAHSHLFPLGDLHVADKKLDREPDPEHLVPPVPNCSVPVHTAEPSEKPEHPDLSHLVENERDLYSHHDSNELSVPWDLALDSRAQATYSSTSTIITASALVVFWFC